MDSLPVAARAAAISAIGTVAGLSVERSAVVIEGAVLGEEALFGCNCSLLLSVSVGYRKFCADPAQPSGG